MMGQAAPHNGQFSNAASTQGPPPFSFPPASPVSSAPSPSVSSIPSPSPAFSQATAAADVTATEVEATPPAEVRDVPEVKKEQEKYGTSLYSILYHFLRITSYIIREFLF